jgi:signal transduction histidine kinase
MSAQLMPKAGSLNGRQAVLASQIETSALRVSQLVSVLIDEVRIRLGQGLPITPAPMDMGETVQQVVKESRAANPERAISLSTTGNLEGVWDKDRLAQVLSNLIGNAIQYGTPQEDISVEAKESADGILLSVRNRGNPVPPELLPRIFDPLTRGAGKAQNRTQASSLGLGLFITKGIVEAHGGRIDVTSGIADGTCFAIRLPQMAKSLQA